MKKFQLVWRLGARIFSVESNRVPVWSFLLEIIRRAPGRGIFFLCCSLLTFSALASFLSSKRISGPCQVPWDPSGCLLCWYFQIFSRAQIHISACLLAGQLWLLTICFLSDSNFVTEFTSDSVVQTRLVILDSSLSLPFHTYEHLMCVRSWVTCAELSLSVFFELQIQCTVPSSVSTWPLVCASFIDLPHWHASPVESEPLGAGWH